MYHLREDTIASIATPPGNGGVAIIRVSGKRAVSIVEPLFSRKLTNVPSHKALFGEIQEIDEVLLLLMREGRSYTGEETVEIQCHGGSLIAKRILELVLKQGARQALPGEFTFRAYINGKIDLSQAEAVQELIHAKNDYALKAAKQQLEGRLSKKVKEFQARLAHIGAILEAWVDFPEEDLAFAPFDDVIKDLEILAEEMERLIASYHEGRVVNEGIALCLAGAPNVGKSSLMNALLDQERAIVTPIPGTTRDLIHEELRINGLNFRLTDTAGIRDTDEVIEREGIRRTKEAIEEADLILFLLDLTDPTRGREILHTLPKEKTILIYNKCDLAKVSLSENLFPYTLALSAKTGEGLDKLKETIDRIIWRGGVPNGEEILITNLRHKEALEEAARWTRRLADGLEKRLSPEFVSQDLRSSLDSLSRIIGIDTTETLLSAIFSNFCVGK